MRRLAILAAAVALVTLTAPYIYAQAQHRFTIGDEQQRHPKITSAVEQLERAVKHMQYAHADFGGHRAAAIAASRQAIEQLGQALAFRARHDTLPAASAE